MLTLRQIKDLLQEEVSLSENVLHLTANETLMSPFATSVLTSPLYNRYLLEHIDMREDSPSRVGNFLFRGLDRVNEIERSAIEVCGELFGAKYCEFRCLSGLHAMQTTMVSLTKPGDKIMRFSTKDGGHFATQHLVKLFGRETCLYAFDRNTYQLDLEGTRKIFNAEQPKLLYIDAMNYLFPFPLRELKEIVGDVPIVYDASHTLGLMAGGQFQDPLKEGADILQANTHKTFFGPQKGIILSNSRELMEKINYNLSMGLVSSQHTNSSISLFIALHEMLIYGKPYAAKVLENATYFAEQLHNRGLKLLAADKGFTKNHQFFIEVTGMSPGPLIYERLLRSNIVVNRSIAFEHVDALRVGVQEATRRGYDRADFDRIADWFAAIMIEKKDPDLIAEQVSALVRSKRKVYYCEDQDTASEEPERVITVMRRADRKKPRWIDFSAEPKDGEIGSDTYNSFRALGEVAGVFEQQVDSAGNLSVRSDGRIIITVTGSYIKDVGRHDLAELVELKDYTLMYRGKFLPSSESLLHYMIYQNTDSNFVAHNHYLPGDQELEMFDVLVIPPKEYASVALAEAVAEVCQNNSIVYVQKHGLVFHDKSLAGCLNLMKRFGQSSLGATYNAVE
jgi:fluorothreonine transaldolase